MKIQKGSIFITDGLNQTDSFRKMEISNNRILKIQTKVHKCKDITQIEIKELDTPRT